MTPEQWAALMRLTWYDDEITDEERERLLAIVEGREPAPKKE